MKIITEKQFNDFASKFFPSKAIHYDETYAFIQAGSCLGKNLHYECDETSVNLHIEGPEWRPIRDYLNANLNKERLTPSHWGRQNCQWTIDNEIHTAVDVMQAFLDILSIIEPVIEQFEGKEPKDYSNIRKDVYEIERIVLGSAQNEHVETQVPNKQTKEPDNLLTLMSNAVQNYETETTLVNTEDKPPLFKITPINPRPITIKRTIKEIGMTFSKTYNQLASAPIQGVDTAGRRTFEVELPPLVSSNDINQVSLSHKINYGGNLKKVVKECFASAVTPNNAPPTYSSLFWKYMANDYKDGNIQVKRGYALKSTFGVLSLIPTFTHQISVSNDDEVSKNPSFCIDERYSATNLTPEELVSIFDKENMLEIHDNEVIFKSKNFSNLHTIVGSYKTPKGFNNICPDCYGAKKLRCGRCHGTGREQYQEGEYADGRPKIKTGQCGKCYGRGYFVCNTCNETGKIDQGTGMIQIQETANLKLRLRESAAESNTFFASSGSVNTNDIRTLQSLELASTDKKTAVKKLQNELKEACERLVERYCEYEWKKENHFVDIDVEGILYQIEQKNYEPVWRLLDELPSIYKYVYTDEGVNDILQEISDCNSSKTKLGKKVDEAYHQLFSEEHVEVLFRNQSETMIDNHHKEITRIINELGQKSFDFLYQQNIQKAKSAFKLDNPDERIIGILEKHEIDDTLLKITIPLENDKVFVVYYSQRDNSLYYIGKLPIITEVEKRTEEEKRIAEERKREEERIKEEKKREKQRLKEEKRQATYSQSMDVLLDESKTTKTGLFSKLFNTKEYKQHKDAEKAIKLMIYVAKADGTLDVDEKELLTKLITSKYDYSKGYTSESRQMFLSLLNSDHLPELTNEDCTFSSISVAHQVIESLVSIAEVNGNIAKEERDLLEKIVAKTGLEWTLKELL